MPKVWALVGLITVLAVGVWIAIFSSYGAPVRPISLPWWALTPLVFAGESAVIHITFRKDAHSFSLSEVVLVAALFLSHPGALLVSQILGNGASLILRRRQVAIKAAFNVAQLVLISGLAMLIFRAVVPPGDPFGPVGWVAAIAVSAISIIVGELAIDSVIRLTGGNLTFAEMAEAMALGAAGASVNAALGLLGVFVVWYDMRGIWLAFVPPTLMYVAYQTHAVQRDHHKRLESMHEVTEAIHTAPDMAIALMDAANSARKLVNATWLEIIVFPDDGSRPHRTIVDLNGEHEAMVPGRLDTNLPEWWAGVIGDAKPAMLEAASRSALVDSPPINKDAVIVPMMGAERFYGYVLAADRLGDVSAFASNDIQLLETVAKQVSVSLDNGRLETSLATVTALKERLEDLVRSKDQFVATISHELRTPLTTVVGLSEEIQATLDVINPDDLREFVGLISDQSNELAHIIEDLLVAARADIGTLAMHPGPIDVMDMVARMTGGSPTQPGVDVSGDCGPGWADPVRFRQVVRNLLSNARRYGGDEVSIEVKQRAKSIDVAVLDNGPGVPAGREDAIFQAYERGADSSDQAVPGSVGLGLAVARQLARMMDGDLKYERDGATTRFIFTIPAATSVASA